MSSPNLPAQESQALPSSTPAVHFQVPSSEYTRRNATATEQRWDTALRAPSQPKCSRTILQPEATDLLVSYEDVYNPRRSESTIGAPPQKNRCNECLAPIAEGHSGRSSDMQSRGGGEGAAPRVSCPQAAVVPPTVGRDDTAGRATVPVAVPLGQLPMG